VLSFLLFICSKIRRGLAPDYTREDFCNVTEVHSYNLWGKENFSLARCMLPLRTFSWCGLPAKKTVFNPILRKLLPCNSSRIVSGLIL
jgi:hypothetical protein